MLEQTKKNLQDAEQCILQQASKLLPTYDSTNLYPLDRVLSSSMIKTYYDSEEDFFTRYMVGGQPLTVPLIVGSTFSAMYQYDDFDPTEVLTLIGKSNLIPILEDARKRIPRIGVTKEDAIVVEYMGWKIRVTLDGVYYPKRGASTVFENKTGRVGWDDYRVSEDLQLTMQAWAVKKKTGKLPKKIILSWVDLNPTTPQRVRAFETVRTDAEVEYFEKAILEPMLNNLEKNI